MSRLMLSTTMGRRRGAIGAVWMLGDDGKIKAPGPFGSMVLMVLRNFRDLSRSSGPGLWTFFHLFSGLSGTFSPGGRHV